MFGDDFVLAIAHQGVIEAGIVAMDSFRFGVHEPVPDIGGVQQGLSGNAADQEAGAAQARVGLDTGDPLIHTARRESQPNIHQGRSR